MTPLEQAAADLREAQANLKAHTPIEKLQNAVTTAEKALIAAASTPAAKPFSEQAGEVGQEFEAMDSVGAEFPACEDEVAVAAEPSADADELFEETEIPAIEESNVAPVDSAAMQDVASALSTSVESLEGTVASETIDATDEVSVEEAVEAADPEVDPNAHLGVNYPANGLAQAE